MEFRWGKFILYPGPREVAAISPKGVFINNKPAMTMGDDGRVYVNGLVMLTPAKLNQLLDADHVGFEAREHMRNALTKAEDARRKNVERRKKDKGDAKSE